MHIKWKSQVTTAEFVWVTFLPRNYTQMKPKSGGERELKS